MGIDENNILTECYGNTLLIRLVRSLNPNHLPDQGIPEIASKMQKRESPKPVVAVVDYKDKQPPYLKEFEQTEADEEGRIVLFKKHGVNHYVVYLIPAFEDWVADQSNRFDIDLKNYGLKNSKFLKQFKNIGSDPKKQMNHLLNDLKQKPDSPFLTIEKWLDQIVGEPDN